jgi:PEP-CTERM motif
MTAQRFLKLGWISVVVFVLSAGNSSGLILVTNDPVQAAAFQAGATIENFDDLSGLQITSYASGQTVPAGSQFHSRDLTAFTAPFFNSGGASFNNPLPPPAGNGNPGTPIGIFDPEGAIALDFKSPNNVAGPMVLKTAPTDPELAFGNGFMEVIFPADMRRVGFWVTQATPGNFSLQLKDSNNSNLPGESNVVGTTGQFIGIERAAADIRGVTIGFVEAFTIDDFTYSSSPIPEPSSAALIALGSLALIRRRR